MGAIISRNFITGDAEPIGNGTNFAKCLQSKRNSNTPAESQGFYDEDTFNQLNAEEKLQMANDIRVFVYPFHDKPLEIHEIVDGIPVTRVIDYGVTTNNEGLKKSIPEKYTSVRIFDSSNVAETVNNVDQEPISCTTTCSTKGLVEDGEFSTEMCTEEIECRSEIVCDAFHCERTIIESVTHKTDHGKSEISAMHITETTTVDVDNPITGEHSTVCSTKNIDIDIEKQYNSDENYTIKNLSTGSVSSQRSSLSEEPTRDSYSAEDEAVELAKESERISNIFAHRTSDSCRNAEKGNRKKTASGNPAQSSKCDVNDDLDSSTSSASVADGVSDLLFDLSDVEYRSCLNEHMKDVNILQYGSMENISSDEETFLVEADNLSKDSSKKHLLPVADNQIKNKRTKA